MSVEKVRLEREAREARAKERAASMPAGDWYASGNFAVDRLSGEKVECETHWDACLAMMAAPKA